MTLLKPRYEYTRLQRVLVEGKRLYSCPNGEALPSVTTILDSTKDKTHLMEWRRKVGEEQAIAITREASGIGTRMHKYLEQYIERGSWGEAGSNPYALQAHQMAQVVGKNALVHVDEVWGSEVSLYFPQIYAGTTDCVGTYKGAPCIIDFKQTNKPKKLEWVTDYFLQLVAYAEAHNKVYHSEIREAHVFMCSRDFTYQQFDITPIQYNKYADMWWDRVEQYYKKQASHA
jgi:genome maintenance exonuclease 1